MGEREPQMSIEDARIERDLFVQGVSVARAETKQWAKHEPVEVSAARPLFYPGWTLVEALCALDGERRGVVAFLQRASDAVLLPGKSEPIHQMNRRGALKLDTDQAVLEYLRFFCAYVWGDDGAFKVVESKDALDGGELSHPVELAPASIQEHDKEAGWLCNAIVSYASYLFRAKLRVRPNGEVEMIDDEPVAQIKGASPVAFASPVRIVTGPPSAGSSTGWPFWLRLIVADHLVGPPEDVAATLRRLGEEIVPATGPNTLAKISLRGLKAGALRYDPAKSLGRGVVLRLEGFEYDRVETDPLQASSAFSEAGAEKSTPGPRPAGFAAARLRLRELLARLQAALGYLMAAKAHEPAKRYIDWLSRQYVGSKPESQGEYVAQPYEQLARVLRNHGSYDEAKRVTMEKLCLERHLEHRWWVHPGAWIMEKFFSHGLFATRSVFVFLGLWLVGTFVFDFANHGRIGVPIGAERNFTLSWPVLNSPVLMVDTVPVSSVIVRTSAQTGVNDRPAMLLAHSNEPLPGELRCGDQIEPLWYALDVFVPLLDLKQEEKCSISAREDAWAWRAFKSLYAVVGALVTSLVVLSVSGVLRRRAEP
jgi:hypothetical protein